MFDSTKRKNKKLCKKYPFLTVFTRGVGHFHKDKIKPDYSTTWEDSLEPGWRKAFCPHIWDELKTILDKASYTKHFHFLDIKEKWGCLRLDYGGVPATIFDEVQEWEKKYEQASEECCLYCGRTPTKYMTLGWYTFICESCAKKQHQEEAKKNSPFRTQLVPVEDLDLFRMVGRKEYFEKHPSKRLDEEED